MSRQLRILLVIGALLMLYVVIKRIRKKKILMQDAIYWVVLAIVLVLMALFPGVIILLAYSLGFYSASNFVFLVIVALLLAKLFSNSAEISVLRHKIEELAQEDALRAKEEDDRLDDLGGHR